MHDDSDAGRLIPVNQPALAIDYLGSGWKNEDDIAASWKFMTKQKNDLINGLRLENASWRNWAKQRHNLKTISPKVLNWLKDSDTTWLYGPLYKAAIDEFDLKRFGTSTAALLPGLQVVDSTTSAPTTPPASSTTSSTTSSIDVGAGAGAMLKPRLKPALKHKTASEIFKADTLFHVQSDLKLRRRFGAQSKALESAVFKELRQPKLRFNDSVEQCVAIDTDAIYEEDEDEDSEHFVDDDDDRAGLNARHEDEDGGILMRISARTQPRSIVRIDPTTLKAASSYGTDEYVDQDELEDATDDDEDDDVEKEEEVEEGEEEVKRENEEASIENDEDDEEYDDFEEGMFDEPIYLGNPYSNAESGYLASQHYGYHPSGVGSTLSDYSLQEQDVAMAEVSYTRPTPPASSAPTPSSSSSKSKDKRHSMVSQGIVATVAATAAPAATTIATTTTAVTTTTAPAAPADPTRPVSEMEAEKALMAANPGGFQQRAADLVTNVKDLVSWASSFVYNSSTF
ncbi:hypothetical protein BGZ70_002451 [Mortierella alpina]|uniref:Nitrogen regulatory protein areA GATA-like domain-containing protein n=1 Tax=Mortierella alpina TaxID=64518 RepID=A0A9P6LWN2_MORAP|nr:hypothetical protein BGZ70_002451 [Mortierella alpina]